MFGSRSIVCVENSVGHCGRVGAYVCFGSKADTRLTSAMGGKLTQAEALGPKQIERGRCLPWMNIRQQMSHSHGETGMGLEAASHLRGSGAPWRVK